VTDVRIVPNFTVGRIGTVNRVMAVFPVRDVWSLPQCEGQRRILPHLSTGSSPRADCGGQGGACGAIHGDRPAVSQWRVSPIHLFRRLQIRTVMVVRSVAAGAGREWPVRQAAQSRCAGFTACDDLGAAAGKFTRSNRRKRQIFTDFAVDLGVD